VGANLIQKHKTNYVNKNIQQKDTLTLFLENRMSTVASFRVLRRISNEVADRFSPGCGDLVT
jgi:hypothetical protein